ncbi:MAG TPA: hypothetical protein VNR65_11115, partial [Geobacterales bacterium]|nr:hypothetical protein [Geobacterales bacterium]
MATLGEGGLLATAYVAEKVQTLLMHGVGFCFGLSSWLGVPDNPDHIRADDSHSPLHLINC